MCINRPIIGKILVRIGPVTLMQWASQNYRNPIRSHVNFTPPITALGVHNWGNNGGFWNILLKDTPTPWGSCSVKYVTQSVISLLLGERHKFTNSYKLNVKLAHPFGARYWGKHGDKWTVIAKGTPTPWGWWSVKIWNKSVKSLLLGARHTIHKFNTEGIGFRQTNKQTNKQKTPKVKPIFF